jgi:O-antigen/teichoic acid export membrane protein
VNVHQQDRGGPLRRNVVWALFGNVGYTAFQWGILVSIAKLGSAADVGIFALGLAVTAPVITLTNLHLRVIEATDARNEYPFSVYLALRLLTALLAIVIIAAVAFGSGYRGTTLALILAVGLAKSIESVSDVIFGLLQEAENLRRIALSMLYKGALSVAAVALGLYFSGNLVIAALTMALGWTVLLACYDLPAAYRLTSIRPSARTRDLVNLTWLAAPMGCVMALASLTTNVPRYSVEANLGPAALGHFAAVAYLFVAGQQPMTAVGAAVTPRLARHFVYNLPAYQRLTRRTVASAAALGLAGVIVSALFGRLVLTIAYAPEYGAQAPVLLWMAVAAGVGFLGKALTASVTAARRLAQQLPIALVSLAVAFVASRILVPRFGLYGAAWAVLATEATRLAWLTVLYVYSLSSAAAAQDVDLSLEKVASTG